MTISKLAHQRTVLQREGTVSKRIASRVGCSSSPDVSNGRGYSSKTSRPCDPAAPHLASGVNSPKGSTSQADDEAVMVLMPSYHAPTQANYEQRMSTRRTTDPGPSVTAPMSSSADDKNVA
jgi:hypothetical protein